MYDKELFYSNGKKIFASSQRQSPDLYKIKKKNSNGMFDLEQEEIR